MVVKVGTAYLQLSQPLVPHSPFLSSLSSKRGRFTSTHLGPWLLRSRSLPNPAKEATHILPRALSSSDTFFSDEDGYKDESFRSPKSRKLESSIDLEPPPWLEVPPERSNWLQEMELISSSVPMQMTKKKSKNKKNEWEEGFKEAGMTAVKKAFSSMVFIIREIHSYTLQLRELLFYEDLQGILDQVQREMHASFCWLFQHIFSCTPTLMVSLMLLLANFTVQSMTHTAIAAHPPPLTSSITTTDHTHHNDLQHHPHLSTLEAPFLKATHLDGGSGGGGRKAKPLAGATDDGRSPSELQTSGFTTAVPAGNEDVGSRGHSLIASLEDEARVWRSVVEAAAEMESATRHEVLMDREVLRSLVAPVTVEVETDTDYPEYFVTELMYRRAVEERPNDPLLLSNYAQFLFLVVHDHDRAEQYFKRAIGELPADAETLSRYANFLWIARNDLCLAEETYLEAIAVDPSNTSYAANYAHFLWSTGGEDTCFPLDEPGEA